MNPADGRQSILIPEAPALVLGAGTATLLTVEGEIATVSLDDLPRRLVGSPTLVCHARSVARRLGDQAIAAYDLLELFAFVHPARFCRPTPRGLAEALDLAVPETPEDAAATLPKAAARLLRALAAAPQGDDAPGIAWRMGAVGWPWAPFVLAALGVPHGPGDAGAARALRVWDRLPQWQGEPMPPAPGSQGVDPAEARQRLAQLLQPQTGAGPAIGAGIEDRPQQADYASAACPAFAPRSQPDAPNLVLAEAGTGVGKTLGYLAPAVVWAEKNEAPVWVSTFTRNLQHQIDGELERAFPSPAEKGRHVVVRKGRENYLCLLNLEEAAMRLPTQRGEAASVGLIARWVAATRDGDMVGGDLPGWLPDLLGRHRTLALADRRGECIYSACPHYDRCFVERSIRRARRARIVIANHALVMVQAALGGLDDGTLPLRLIFDEGHHLFDAADGAFGAHLTGRETAELRRWILGSEVGRRSRARGLRRRIEDLLVDDQAGQDALTSVMSAAAALPAEGWLGRLSDSDANAATGPGSLAVGAGGAHGPTEAFLSLVRRQVYARAPWRDGPYGLECEPTDPIEGLRDAATHLRAALVRLQRPMLVLAERLKDRLDRESDRLDSALRQRLDAAARGLVRRARHEVGAWCDMLAAIGDPAPPEFVDWLAIERADGRDVDVGYFRHWLDPMIPFAGAVGPSAHGMLVTSATLMDGTGDVERDWQSAETRTGARHMPAPAVRAQVPSPFDYARQTRVLIVRDVRKDDLDQVAAAYRELIFAADGGALGLFTAISRLRGIHQRIAEPIEAAGLGLYAQHMDGMDVSTLVDIFRGDPRASLLGTDAVRDGVDVPGRSLRLIVFDRVPWPRPTILHRARRTAFDGRSYDDMLTRLRLKQAYGRLIRRADDVGVFVLLDPMMPSRLCGAFPEGVTVERTGLADAVDITRRFLALESP